jgi:hypothetical protein
MRGRLLSLMLLLVGPGMAAAGEAGALVTLSVPGMS